jgi:hypothetical protein
VGLLENHSINLRPGNANLHAVFLPSWGLSRTVEVFAESLAGTRGEDERR